ncbi:MAG: hypothetical protein ABI373_10350 [Flavobacteriales bacterium]
MRNSKFIAILPFILLCGCSNDTPGTDAATSHIVGPPVTARAAEVPPANPELDPANETSTLPNNASWRMGDSVLALMGDLHGRTVADLFAGDGYYTWKLLDAGARVLAMDDDTSHVATLLAAKKAKGISDDRLLIRLSSTGRPVLLPAEADMALITRELSTIPDRDAWFKQVQRGLRGHKPTYVVNFLPQPSPIGPPAGQRMDYNSAADVLTAVGYTDISILYRKIPYRYILFASIPPVQPD